MRYLCCTSRALRDSCSSITADAFLSMQVVYSRDMRFVDTHSRFSRSIAVSVNPVTAVNFATSLTEACAPSPPPAIFCGGGSIVVRFAGSIKSDACLRNFPVEIVDQSGADGGHKDGFRRGSRGSGCSRGSRVSEDSERARLAELLGEGTVAVPHRDCLELVSEVVFLDSCLCLLAARRRS